MDSRAAGEILAPQAAGGCGSLARRGEQLKPLPVLATAPPRPCGALRALAAPRGAAGACEVGPPAGWSAVCPAAGASWSGRPGGQGHPAARPHPQPPPPPPFLQRCTTSGEWVNAVLAVAPHLDASGLKQALLVLNEAIENINRIKALHGVINSAADRGGALQTTPHAVAAQSSIRQITEQQQALLRQLHHLRATSAANLCGKPPTCPPPEMKALLAQFMRPQEQPPEPNPQHERQFPHRPPTVGFGIVTATPMLPERSMHCRQLDQAPSTTPQDDISTSASSSGARDENLSLAMNEAVAMEMAMAALEPPGQSQTASLALEPPCQALEALEPQCQIEHGRALLELLGHSRPACPSSADAALDEEPPAQARAAPRPPQAGPADAPGRRQVATTSTRLQELSDEDPACLVVVGSLHKLGFRAEQKLRSHFSRYGAVSRVMVVQRQQDPESSRRWRLSSLGFVLMKTTESAAKILSAGPEQQIDGVVVPVHRFDYARAKEDLRAAEGCEDAVASDEGDGWHRDVLHKPAQ